MRKIRVILLITWLAAVVTACSKSSSDGGGNNNGSGPHVINTQDTIPPVIEIHTPSANQVFRSGHLVSITGKVTDGDGLYQGRIKIINDANSSVVMDQQYVIHGVTMYNFSISHTVSVSANANYTVYVNFEDHGLNSVTRSVKIKAEP